LVCVTLCVYVAVVLVMNSRLPECLLQGIIRNGHQTWTSRGLQLHLMGECCNCCVVCCEVFAPTSCCVSAASCAALSAGLTAVPAGPSMQMCRLGRLQIEVAGKGFNYIEAAHSQASQRPAACHGASEQRRCCWLCCTAGS
jgi:hypothetical protein